MEKNLQIENINGGYDQVVANRLYSVNINGYEIYVLEYSFPDNKSRRLLQFLSYDDRKFAIMRFKDKSDYLNLGKILNSKNKTEHNLIILGEVLPLSKQFTKKSIKIYMDNNRHYVDTDTANELGLSSSNQSGRVYLSPGDLTKLIRNPKISIEFCNPLLVPQMESNQSEIEVFIENGRMFVDRVGASKLNLEVDQNSDRRYIMPTELVKCLKDKNVKYTNLSLENKTNKSSLIIFLSHESMYVTNDDAKKFGIVGMVKPFENYTLVSKEQYESLKNKGVKIEEIVVDFPKVKLNCYTDPISIIDYAAQSIGLRNIENPCGNIISLTKEEIDCLNSCFDIEFIEKAKENGSVLNLKNN